MRLSPNTGTYVSGAGHAVFILYLIVGGLFVARETDMDVSVSNVSIISGEEFTAMQAQSPGEPDLPPAPQAPAEVDQPAPAPVEDPPPETPTAPTPAQPAPAEEDPVIEPPAPAPVEPPAPEVQGDPGASLIDPNAVPIPRAADRIAEEAAEAPDPEVKIDEVEQAAISEEPSPETTQVEEAQEATAPEEATTEIVTEADEPATAAPTRSARPGRKPTPPAPQVAETPAEPDQPTVPGLAESIADAVAEANQDTAQADNANPGGGTGSPITRSEKGAFILGIQKCWNVGALGTDALLVSVIVGFEMEQTTAKPVTGSIRMISSTGGSGDAVKRAYDAARRAIIRCGINGYDLPLDKYDQWREVQVSFNATRREIR